jgi:hypothetical protein
VAAVKPQAVGVAVVQVEFQRKSSQAKPSDRVEMLLLPSERVGQAVALREETDQTVALPALGLTHLPQAASVAEVG